MLKNGNDNIVNGSDNIVTKKIGILHDKEFSCLHGHSLSH